MKKLSYKMLYIAWAVLFALTAVLGFVFPAVETLGARLALAGLAVVFFLPPWLILAKSKSEGNRFHVRLVGFLAVSSIVLTVLVMILNIMSPLWSEAVGIALNAAFIIVSTPMFASNYYALSLFLWGTLIAEAFFRK